MIWKKELWQSAKLYLILDTSVNDYDRLFEILKQSVPHGIDVVQLRDKQGLAKNILKFSDRVHRYLKNRVPYIINDRIDLAIAAKAAGVHLGQDDLPISVARKMIGLNAIIGISCQTIEQAQIAQRSGADYIGVGSVFKTLTKPNRNPMDLKLLSKLVDKISIPVFAIGGIRQDNVSAIQAVGIRRIAVCRAICCTSNISRTTRALKSILVSH